MQTFLTFCEVLWSILSDIKWYGNGTNHKSIVSKQNTFHFLVAMKCKILFKNLQGRFCTINRSTSQYYFQSYIYLSYGDSTWSHVVFPYSSTAIYIMAQYMLVVQMLCALITVYLLLFELNMNECMHAWMNARLDENNAFSCMVAGASNRTFDIVTFLW